MHLITEKLQYISFLLLSLAVDPCHSFALHCTMAIYAEILFILTDMTRNGTRGDRIVLVSLVHILLL